MDKFIHKKKSESLETLIFSKQGSDFEMEKVRVFTETFFHGSFGNGKGEYYIVLECLDRNGELRTKEKYARFSGRKKNEAELMPLVEALRSFNRKCEIELHMAEGFVSGTIRAGHHLKWQQDGWRNRKGSIIKNQPLWQQYAELSEGHRISVVAESETEYSGAMRLQLQAWLKLQGGRQTGSAEREGRQWDMPAKTGDGQANGNRSLTGCGRGTEDFSGNTE